MVVARCWTDARRPAQSFSLRVARRFERFVLSATNTQSGTKASTTGVAPRRGVALQIANASCSKALQISEQMGTDKRQRCWGGRRANPRHNHRPTAVTGDYGHMGAKTTAGNKQSSSNAYGSKAARRKAARQLGSKAIRHRARWHTAP